MTETIKPALKIAACATAGLSLVISIGIVSLTRRVSDAVGLAPPTSKMLEEELPLVNSPLIRHLPQLEKTFAWRSLGVNTKSPVHICRVPALSSLVPGGNTKDKPTEKESATIRKAAPKKLELLVKREDLLSPLYGGNKVRTLQHQLAVCEARRERGETSFNQLVSQGSAGSNQIVACIVHARALGWNGKNNGENGKNTINPFWSEQDAPDLDNTLNMLSVLSFSDSIGFKYNWGESPSLGDKIRAILGAWTQKEFVPMMLGGNCPSGVLGQVGAMLELAEQIEAGESPDPVRIYVPVGSACTVSGLVIGAVLARYLQLPAFLHPNFKIVGCNVHDGLARADAKYNFHVNPLFGFIPLSITYSVKSACDALKQLGGPDLEADALDFMKHHLEMKADPEIVGTYGAHSEKSRAAARLYDEEGIVVDSEGKECKNLWICGHFVAKAFQPLLADLEKELAEEEAANANGKDNNSAALPHHYMLWMTKSAVQPRGKEDEWNLLLQENESVLEWANDGVAESPKFRLGKVSTFEGKADDYRSIMTQIE